MLGGTFMAAAARDLRYRAGQSVDGNLARNLDWEVRERELRHAGEVPRHQEAAEPQVRARPRIRTRAAQHVSLLSVAGFCVAGAPALLVLVHYIQLTQLSALETENVVLSAQYEQIFDLSSVREAAVAMGMTKPSSSQIYYIDLSEGDSAIVYQEASPGLLERLRESLHHGIYAVVEYFD